MTLKCDWMKQLWQIFWMSAWEMSFMQLRIMSVNFNYNLQSPMLQQCKGNHSWASRKWENEFMSYLVFIVGSSTPSKIHINSIFHPTYYTHMHFSHTTVTLLDYCSVCDVTFEPIFPHTHIPKQLFFFC